MTQTNDDAREEDELATRSIIIADMMEKMLAGENPALQVTVVMQMFATLIAGQHPSIRRQAMQSIVDAATDLVPVEVARMIEAGMAPGNWVDPHWTTPQGTA